VIPDLYAPESENCRYQEKTAVFLLPPATTIAHEAMKYEPHNEIRNSDVRDRNRQTVNPTAGRLSVEERHVNKKFVFTELKKCTLNNLSSFYKEISDYDATITCPLTPFNRTIDGFLQQLIRT
jgi:hypothetical protein